MEQDVFLLKKTCQIVKEKDLTLYVNICRYSYT
jgi:hypothetical protein